LGIVAGSLVGVIFSFAASIRLLYPVLSLKPFTAFRKYLFGIKVSGDISFP